MKISLTKEQVREMYCALDWALDYLSFPTPFPKNYYEALEELKQVLETRLAKE